MCKLSQHRRRSVHNKHPSSQAVENLIAFVSKQPKQGYQHMHIVTTTKTFSDDMNGSVYLSCSFFLVQNSKWILKSITKCKWALQLNNSSAVTGKTSHFNVSQTNKATMSLLNCGNLILRQPLSLCDLIALNKHTFKSQTSHSNKT